MKIFASRKTDNTITLDIVVEAQYPELGDAQIAASSQSEIKLPEGPVIARQRSRITYEMIEDFEAFMEDIEILCEVNYKLIGTYKHVSSDHSHYYNYLVADDAGNILVNLRLRLRISNHSPRKSRAQKYNKNQELQSEKLHELLTQEQIDSLESYTKIITINDDKYSSYEEAFDHVKTIIHRAVEVMKRRSKSSND